MKFKPRYFVIAFSCFIIILSFSYIIYVVSVDYEICKWQGDISGDKALLSCKVYGFSDSYKGEIQDCSSYDSDITDDLTPICELRGRALRYPTLMVFVVFVIIGFIPFIVLFLQKYFHKNKKSKIG